MGPSDFARRLPSALFAVCSFAALLALLLRVSSWAWFGVAALCLTPVFVEYSTYARPYALPMALMLGFIWALDTWRQRRNRAYLAIALACALLMPLARTTEPSVLLGMTLLSLIVIRWRAGKEEGGWVWGPIVVTSAGLLVAIPMALVLVDATETVRARGVNSVSIVLDRLWSDVAPAHIEASPVGTIGFLVAGAGITLWIVQLVRGGKNRVWWLGPVLAATILSVVAFVLLAAPAQTYYPRYTYFSLPVLAIGLTLALTKMRSGVWSIAAALGMLGISAYWTLCALNEVHQPDYGVAAERVAGVLEEGETVVWEQDRDLSSYRPRVFPGIPLYLSRTSELMSSREIADGGRVIMPGHRLFLLMEGFSDGLEGWTEVEVADGFSLVVPDFDSGWDVPDQVDALWDACSQLDPAIGSYLCAAAVRIQWESGEMVAAEAAYRSMLDRIGDPAVGDAIKSSLADLPLSA